MRNEPATTETTPSERTPADRTPADRTPTSPPEPGRPRPLLEAGVAIAVAVVSVALAIVALRISAADLVERWQTGGDDQILHYMLFTSATDAFPFAVNPEVGFPDGLNVFFSAQFDVSTALLVSALGLLIPNGILLLNVFYLVTFALVGISGYGFFRALRMRRLTAAVFAVILNLAPYHLTRVRDGHAFLASFWAIPLIGILILIVAGPSTDPFRAWVERAITRRSRILRSLLPPAILGLLVASSGAYYFVFGVIVVGGVWAAATVSRLVRRRARGEHLVPTAGIGFLGLFVVIELAILSQNFGERYAPYFQSRSVQEAEYYGGKLLSLILPWPGSDLPVLSEFSARYQAETGVIATTEAPGAPVIASAGVIAILLILLVLAFSSTTALRVTAVGRAITDDRVRVLSAAFLWTFLFYIVSGFGMLVALLVGPQIRAWSRLSIVLIVLALGVVGVLVDSITSRFKARTVVLALLAVVAIFDQVTGAATAVQLRPTDDSEMKQFVAESDEALPDGCGVAQLPVKSFPDSKTIGDLNDYDEALPYLFTEDDSLRWSYGAVGGTYGWDVWKDSAASPESYRETIEQTQACAVQIDLNGYTQNVDGWKPLVEAVAGTDVPDVVSSSGRYILFVVPGD